jgi:hypothetical protein
VTVDVDRLIDRYAIAVDAQTVAERELEAALHDAQHAARPRLILINEDQRLRVLSEVRKSAASRP